MTEYIKNAEFLEALKVYNREKKLGNTDSTAYKRAYNKIGLAIKLIADGLAKKPNFSGYSYIEEMKSDAMENCITYLDNFKVELDMNYAVIRHIPYTQKGQILYKTGEATANTRANALNKENPATHYSVEYIEKGDFGTEIKSSKNDQNEAVRKHEEYSTQEEKRNKSIFSVYQGKPKEKQKKEQQPNPFGYFTQICWFAFIRRIEKEDKQSKIKAKMIKESGILDQITQEGDDSVYVNSYIDTLKSYVDNVDEDTPVIDEDEIIEKTAKKKPKGIEEFIEQEEE